MSILNWFSKKAAQPAASRLGRKKLDSPARALEARDRLVSQPASRPSSEPVVNRSAMRKARRHARREQLYTAVREAMTRCGVLASSYKFKVLSLDQAGNQFLVMMDVPCTLAQQPEKLADIETMVSLTAKARFEIEVTAVYWRSDTRGAAPVANPNPSGSDTGRVSPTSPAAAALSTSKPPAARRYEPIQDDEVAAFKLALASAAASNPTTTDATGKTRSGPHSYTLLTGFEDTEMSESTALPALSNTQYGDLN
jgi:hypothetical protein